MKINILLPALASLFYTALGPSANSPSCSAHMMKCEDNGNSDPFQLLFCYKGRWWHAEDCSKSGRYCQSEPKAHCESRLRDL